MLSPPILTLCGYGVLLSTLLTTGCATTNEARPLAPGATLHYLRSNSDGSLPERVLVHIVSRSELAVAKMVAPCTSAALVTAQFDGATGEALRMTGGRLGRTGQQQPQAWLIFDPEERQLLVSFGGPDGAHAESLSAPPAPWRMYDFDLAEFAILGPRGPGSDFTFGLAMAWPDGEDPTMRLLGRVDANFVASPDSQINIFTVDGPALPGGGELRLDAANGHVVSARFQAPNHPGYTDFMLTLERIEHGEPAWRDALSAHWENCPPDDR